MALSVLILNQIMPVILGVEPTVFDRHWLYLSLVHLDCPLVFHDKRCRLTEASELVFHVHDCVSRRGGIVFVDSY